MEVLKLVILEDPAIGISLPLIDPSSIDPPLMHQSDFELCLAALDSDPPFKRGVLLRDGVSAGLIRES